MIDPQDNLATTFEPVHPAWTPERAALVRQRIDAGVRRRKRARLATALTTVVLFGSVGWNVLVSPRRIETASPVPVAQAPDIQIVNEVAPQEPAPVVAAREPGLPSPRRFRVESSVLGWRSLAQRGRFDDAWAELSRQGFSNLPDEPAALLLAADVARLSHHPREAIGPLRAVVDRHARDPRAGLAAFTLGLVELQELGRPREAAVAFARSRTLDPKGELAEDALAREVEALFRAGDSGRAGERAAEYKARYPRGRWLAAVRNYGGL